MNINKINIIRRFQTITSIALFIGVFSLCWYVTGFKLEEIQLSFWGIDTKLGWVWNSCLCLLSISIFYNIYYFIKHHHRLNKRFNEFLWISFLFTTINLFLTGAIDLTYTLHVFTAFTYFFAFPLSVFLFAHLNRKSLRYQEWLIHTLFSICMAVFPLLVINFFPGLAIAETIHSVFVIGWNLWILTLA